jgi:hypothetical protein
VGSKIAAAFAGQVWVVAWQDGDEIHGRIKVSRIGLDGAVLDAPPIEVGAGNAPALASNATSTVLVYTGVWRDSYPNGIAALLFGPDGNFLMPDGVHAIAEGLVREPAIATNGTEFMVVFSAISGFGAHIGGRPGIYGVRLDANSEAIGQPFPIADAELDEQSPSIVASGEDYLVAYALFQRSPIIDPPIVPIPPARSFVCAKRVLHTGVLAGTTIDQPGEFLGEGVRPMLVANGTRTGVFFRNVQWGDSQPYQLALFGTQIDANAMPVDGVWLLMLGESYAPDFTASLMRDGAFRLAFSRVTSDAHAGRNHRVFLRVIADVGGRRRPSRR